MSNKTPLIANVVDRYTGRDGSEQAAAPGRMRCDTCRSRSV
ncbi:hypothetical protein [Xanthomonas citri]|nr:hypothetical protein [Xanthomonas citri]